MVQIDLAKQNGKYSVQALLEIMSILRSPGGCPWDIEQTHFSIRNSVLEEAYEVVDAIDCDNSDMLCEELGDLLLQVVFHSRISDENSQFSFEDVVDGICKKLILRHPHVFGNDVVKDSDEVLVNWDKIKMQEKHQESYTDTLKSVPNAFPSLMRAQKVQKRAAKAGLDWADISGPVGKIKEETAEFENAVKNVDSDNMTEELGDLLFSVVNAARHMGIDAEQALKLSTDKFISRFETVENTAVADGGIENLPPEKLDVLWKAAKNQD